MGTEPSSRPVLPQRLILSPLFTRVCGIGVLRTSPFGHSRKFVCSIVHSPGPLPPKSPTPHTPHGLKQRNRALLPRPPALLALLASGRVPYVAGRRAARVRPHEAAGRGVHHAADQSHRLDHRRRQRHLRQPDPDSRFGPLGADQPSATRAARAVEALRQQEEGPRLLDPGPSSSRLLHPGAWKPSQNV
jgi:hypothetical protein